MPITHTARSSGYYYVYINGVVVSGHITEREALEVASNLAEENPGDTIQTTHEYQVDTVYEAPVVEVFEGIPQSGASVVTPDFYEYFTTSPGATWLSNMNGVCNNYTGSNVGDDNTVTPTYHSDGPNSTGYIRATVTGSVAQGYMRYTTGISDNNHWLRYWRRFSGTERSSGSSEDMLGKGYYYESQDISRVYVDASSMSGTTTGTVSGNMTYNSTTFKWDGTVDTGLNLQYGSSIFFNTLTWSAPGGISPATAMVYSYDSGTGAIELFPQYQSSSWTSPPTNGATFEIVCNVGDTIEYDGGGGYTSVGEVTSMSSLYDGVSGDYWIGVFYTSHPGSAATGTIRIGGSTVFTTISWDDAGKRSTSQWYTDDADNSKLPLWQDTRGGNQYNVWNLAADTVFGFTDGNILCPASGWNEFSNRLNFIPDEHANEWIELIIYQDCTVSPWVTEWYLTNKDAIDVHGLSEGTSQNISGTTHFNRCPYVKFLTPAPARANSGDSAKYYEHGSYVGNSLDDGFQTGEWHDYGLMEQVLGGSSGASNIPFADAFVKNV